MSAAADIARKMLRDMPSLVDALTCYVRAAVLERGDYDSRSVENCVCVLRNLSYRCVRIASLRGCTARGQHYTRACTCRCQEIDDPHYDQRQHMSAQDLKQSKAERSRSVPGGGSPKVKRTFA